jgi:hypothetical protein
MNPWDNPAWTDQATAWIGQHVELTGAVQTLKARDWSCVLTAPTEDGPVFMKAGSPATSFEPALVEALSADPSRTVLAPLAVDLDRSWMILPDGGTELRGEVDRQRRLELWERALSSYAELQRDVAPHVDRLIAAGVPDFRLERVDGLIDALAPANRAEVEARALPLVERLAAGPIPASVQHDDLHGGNILVRDGRPVVFDWGDAAVAHPFMSMTVALRAFTNTDGCGDPERLVAAYLGPWTGYGSPAQLEATLADAVELGKLWRAFTYNRLASGLPRPLHPIIDGGAEGWTDVFLGRED